MHTDTSTRSSVTWLEHVWLKSNTACVEHTWLCPPSVVQRAPRGHHWWLLSPLIQSLNSSSRHWCCWDTHSFYISQIATHHAKYVYLSRIQQWVNTVKAPSEHLLPLVSFCCLCCFVGPHCNIIIWFAQQTSLSSLFSPSNEYSTWPPAGKARPWLPAETVINTVFSAAGGACYAMFAVL